MGAWSRGANFRTFDGCMVQGCQLQGFWWVHGPGVPTSGLLMGAWSRGANFRAFDGCMVQGCQLQGFWWVHGRGGATCHENCVQSVGDPGGRGFKPLSVFLACQFENFYGPAFPRTLNPPSRIPGSAHSWQAPGHNMQETFCVLLHITSTQSQHVGDILCSIAVPKSLINHGWCICGATVPGLALGWMTSRVTNTHDISREQYKQLFWSCVNPPLGFRTQH